MVQTGQVFLHARVVDATTAMSDALVSLQDACEQTAPGRFQGEEAEAILKAAHEYKKAWNFRNREVADVLRARLTPAIQRHQ